MILLALSLPLLSGVLWMRLLYPEPLPGRWPLILGFGYVLGMLAVPWLLRLQSLLGFGLSPEPSLFLLALSLLPPIWIKRRRAPAPPVVPSVPEPTWQRWLYFLLGAWLVVRFANLALEVWWRPLFPWDAWTTWGVRAKVWTQLETLVPFVDPQSWLRDAPEGAYALAAWQYPLAPSLIAAWLPLAAGAWNETWANLPWLGCGLALALGYYGQARLWGIDAWIALIFTGLLLSLPMLDTHIALAGYADLWMATALGLGFSAFLHWIRDREIRQGVLALLLILGCLSLKREGLLWALLFLPTYWATRPRGYPLVLGLMILGLLSWIGLYFFGEIRVQLPYLGSFSFGLQGEWAAVLQAFFVVDHWHLLAYGIPVLVLLGLRPENPVQRATWVWGISALFVLYVLFFWTQASQWAAHPTSLNRLFLQIVPALLFWEMVVLSGMLRWDQERAKGV